MVGCAYNLKKWKIKLTSAGKSKLILSSETVNDKDKKIKNAFVI